MKQLIAILGPTAVGKTTLSIQLAQRLGGEILSCDSMQIYRGMDIGTAKPDAAQRAAVPHHLIDIAGIHESYHARRYVDDANRILKEKLYHHPRTWLCGGTGMYARALLEGYIFLPSDPEIRQAVEQEYHNRGSAPLLEELAAIDPETAKRVKDNPRRLQRAVEAIRLTGKPLVAEKQLPPQFVSRTFILTADPVWLRRRISIRTREMLNNGWIEETERLIKQGLEQTPTAGQAIGYAQITQYLHGKILSFDALVEAIETATARYAKRQRTWFRHQHPNAEFIPVDSHMQPDELADQIQIKLDTAPKS